MITFEQFFMLQLTTYSVEYTSVKQLFIISALVDQNMYSTLYLMFLFR